MLSATDMGDHRVWFDHRVRDDILDDIRRHRRWLETGGPLVGYVAEGDFVIVRAVGVPVATRRRTTFQPQHRAVDQILAEQHRRSGGHLRYLGSWHSHPSGSALPSPTDRRTAKNIAQEPAVELPSPLQLIAATSTLPWRAHVQELGCWQWSPSDQDLTQKPISWTWTDLRGSG
jgi:integrative and conjugative element protein (TIGR02256 family)